MGVGEAGVLAALGQRNMMGLGFQSTEDRVAGP